MSQSGQRLISTYRSWFTIPMRGNEYAPKGNPRVMPFAVHDPHEG